jgi:Flp pilus assembly pilin Flp
MTEYIVIIALVAIALIGIVGIFGSDLRELFAQSTDKLSGVPQKEYIAPRENWRDNAGKPGIGK